MFLRMGAAALALAVTGVIFMVLFGPTPDAAAVGMCEPITVNDFDIPGETTTTDASSAGHGPNETTPSTEVTTTSRHETSTTGSDGDTTTTATSETTTTSKPCAPFVYQLSYPLAREGRVISVLGDLRDGGERLHHGTDIAAELLTPVLAVREGTVSSVHNGVGSPDDCCWLSIEHDDGWSSWYIHLNNDTFGTDDGLGRGIRADIAIGDRVDAGDLIGWVGDSGNAEDARQTHMHFELRMPDGTPIDAVASLRSADRPVSRDAENDAGHPYLVASLYLASRGVPWACDQAGMMSCPNLPAELADLGRAMTMLTGGETESLDGTYGIEALYGDPEPNQFIVKKLLGCDDPRCEPHWVTKAELARLAALAARQLMSPDGLFGHEPGELLELPDRASAVAFLRMTGRLDSCQLPLDDKKPLTRGEAAYLLVSWTGIADVDACPEVALPIR